MLLMASSSMAPALVVDAADRPLPAEATHVQHDFSMTELEEGHDGETTGKLEKFLEHLQIIAASSSDSFAEGHEELKALFNCKKVSRGCRN